MVAAWIRALTGVGPSMASGSQTCSGNWADLPMAPQKIRMAVSVAMVPNTGTAMFCRPASTSGWNSLLKVSPASPLVSAAAEA